MRYIILAIILGLCASQAQARDLISGDLFLDSLGCEWYVTDTTDSKGYIRTINGIKEFKQFRIWSDNSYVGHACIGSKEAFEFEKAGAQMSSQIWHIDERGVKCGEYHIPNQESHIQGFWSVPTGNCKENKP